MGLFARRGRTQADNTTQQPAGSARDRLAWLPGAVQVAVAGETFHADAIRTVQWASSPGEPVVAVLTPEPDNFHDPHAVAVHLNGQHVGYLPPGGRRPGPADARQVRPGARGMPGLDSGRDPDA